MAMHGRAFFVIFGSALLCALVLLSGSPTESAAADRDCSDFSSQAAAQEFFVAAGGPASDPHRLDADGDGIACESNPCPCGTGAGTTPPPPVVPVTPPPPEPGPVPVRQGVVLERVVDGDTVEDRFPDDSLASVRLIGIDTPEKYGATECGAEEASAAMERRVQPGQRLRLIWDRTQGDVDYYGRLLRYVEIWASRRDLGQAQIQSGWGKVYVFDSDFIRLDSGERKDRRKAEYAAFGPGVAGVFTYLPRMDSRTTRPIGSVLGVSLRARNSGSRRLRGIRSGKPRFS
jgi:endonuclease YncB( thermonuclease family)